MESCGASRALWGSGSEPEAAWSDTIQQKSAEQLESTECTECAERLGEGKESMKWAKSVDCVTRTESSKRLRDDRIESPVPPPVIFPYDLRKNPGRISKIPRD